MANQTRKPTILIVDDSEINRSILADILGEEYEIIEAENGLQGVAALQKLAPEISLVLLDIVMPEMDGFGVLEEMNQNHWIGDIPVIIISAESSSNYIGRAYELGVTDFIPRPFDTLVVHHRVVNTILLYGKQKKLVSMVVDQIYQKERQSNLMIDVLSHIVEFRNGESGQHVLRVRALTELLLQRLVQKTDRYHLSADDISRITIASALHDIGKISIDDKVLNKAGKLTPEEFAVMKTHSLVGAEMLENLSIHQGEPLLKEAYDICRWHHERYDGRGYPDGLKGDGIPISAQVVALADVYDALTSPRVYKPAFSHEKAIQMILDGQCGAFNPLLLECLEESADAIWTELGKERKGRIDQLETQNIARELHRYEELAASERTLQLLDHERMKYNFFASMTQEIQFEYVVSPAMLTLSAWGAEKLGMGETVMDPLHNEKTKAIVEPGELQSLANILHSTSPEDPVVTYDCQLTLDGQQRWFRIIARAIWSTDEPPRYTGAIGKAIDIHESHMKMRSLEQIAFHDTLTGLLDRDYAKKCILERIKNRPSSNFALAIFDLDHFKSANDAYGHKFGDRVLSYVADLLLQSVRTGDIVSRVGGDEFLIFMGYKEDVEPIISRIFHSLCSQYEHFTISISMGISKTADVGTDYEMLFFAADQALYTVKRSERGHYRFYDESMKMMFSAISSIDGAENADK